MKAFIASRYPDAELEDITQEVFLRTWIACEHAPIRSPKTFLFTLARNLAVSHFRRASNLRRHPMTDDELRALRDGAADVHRLVHRREQHTRLQTAIAALPPRARRVVIHRLKGKRSPQIASLLGVSESTVHNHLSQVVSRLRTALAVA